VNGWEELVATALLGTQRRPLDKAALPGSVRSLLDGQSAQDAAAEFLDVAALMTGYRRAGLAVGRKAEPVAAAPPDERLLIASAARARLARLLSMNDPDVFDEWLLAVRDRGLRVSPERLPALASAAGGRVASRPLTAAVAGPLGEWLAGLNPEWSFLSAHAAAAGQHVWRYGTIPQRAKWLAELLVTEPVRARAELAAAWLGEPAPARLEFLSVLGEALSPEDGEFLETVLDDRAEQVRELAVDLLHRLPDSAFADRMAGRIRTLVSVQPRPLRRDVLVVNLPEACDEEMLRDGVRRVPPGGARRAWWLKQLITAAPMRVWAEFSSSPAALLRMPIEGADERLVREALTGAVARQQNAAWARALLDADPWITGAALMITALPREQWAGAVVELARKASSSRMADTVGDLPRPWPVDLGFALLDWLVTAPDERVVSSAARVIARGVPPSCLNHSPSTGPLPEDTSPWRRELAATLTFRREMYEELR
jgi:hypothetical protein